MDTNDSTPETRGAQLIRMAPSLRLRLDLLRAPLRQSLSDLVEELLIEAIEARKTKGEG
jgi:hypothetical protein